ncbi:MAG TPA: potassium-transporting ATPase subunit KdpB, partial [Candidatus Dormibacteraeota bacterium]
MTGAILVRALLDAALKLDPRTQIRNPVMFVVCVGTVVTLVESVAHRSVFDWAITATLFLTVLFANFAEAVAEGRGRAQADSLRRTRTDTPARRLGADGVEEAVAAALIAKGDLVICEANDIIPSDGEVVEGVASIDESAITGESAPVIRESGGDRSAVTGGTRVLSDRIVVRVTAERGHTFLDRMIGLVEGASRQKTPNELALTILLAALTIIFVPVCVALAPFAGYAHGQVSVVVLVALLVCLIPTTIGALLSAIGIAGMDRLVQRNVLAMSGRAVEAAGDVSTLLLDKTGTITLGNRMAEAFIPLPGVDERELADAAQLASLADDTPEGRSIVVLAKHRFAIRGRQLAGQHRIVPFQAQTRMSGLDIGDRQIRKGAGDAVRSWVTARGGPVPETLSPIVERLARAGSTPLVVADGPRLLGVVELKDVVKSGIKARFAELRRMGIRTVMVTGDNPLTAATIAAEAGVDDFLAEATPEAKM